MFRVNYRTVDGSGRTEYAAEYRLTENGQLVFTDLDGKDRVISAATKWDVCEVEHLPPNVRREQEEAELIADGGQETCIVRDPDCEYKATNAGLCPHHHREVFGE